MSKSKNLVPVQGSTALAEIKERTQDYARAVRSEGTLKVYRWAWLRFVKFCKDNGVQSKPASGDTVIRYIDSLVQSGRKISGIEVELAAIGFVHRKEKLPDPLKDEDVVTVREGIRRMHGQPKTGKEPVTVDHLKELLAKVPKRSLRGKRDRAILLLGFAGAFRRSELVSLDVSDLKFDRDQLRVLIRRGKTDQTGQGKYKHIPYDGELDVVKAVRDWMKAANLKSGALFRSINRWNDELGASLTPQVVKDIVKTYAGRAGLNASNFAGHSLRSGYVTEGAIRNVPDHEMMEQTGQTYQTIQNYKRLHGRGALEATRTILGTKTK